jgi:hypothetical protein
VIGSETITVGNAAIGFTASALVKQSANSFEQMPVIRARMAFISVETQEVRINFDPTVTVTATTNGHALAVASSMIIDGTATLADVRFIKTGGSDAAVRVTYYG